MKTLLTLLLLLGFSLPAHAGIAGRWIGWGDWLFDGSGSHCDDVSLEFRETATVFERVGGHFGCEFVSLDMEPLALEKHGEELLLNGRKVGIFSDTHYEWKEQYSENVKIKVTVERSGNHMDYLEEWTDQGKPLYQIKGRVFLRE